MAYSIPQELSRGRLRGDSIEGFEGDGMMDNDQVRAVSDRFVEYRIGQAQAGHQGLDSHGRIACQESDVVPAFGQSERGDLIQMPEDFLNRWLAIGILGWANHSVDFNL
jgi:hypothetical protein